MEMDKTKEALYAHLANTVNTMKDDTERRVVDARTGGMKGQKSAQLSTIDPLAILEEAKVGGFGTVKYARYNYLRGYAWSLSIDALLRHVLAFASGETHDPETGLNHMAHAAWHAHALVSFSERGLGTDDRVSAFFADPD